MGRRRAQREGGTCGRGDVSAGSGELSGWELGIGQGGVGGEGWESERCIEPHAAERNSCTRCRMETGASKAPFPALHPPLPHVHFTETTVNTRQSFPPSPYPTPQCTCMSESKASASPPSPGARWHAP
eukprot:scaffold4962_cov97-Isochrysis_galbana.AAC.3